MTIPATRSVFNLIKCKINESQGTNEKLQSDNNVINFQDFLDSICIR